MRILKISDVHFPRGRLHVCIEHRDSVEAMQAGTPVVTTAVMGTAEIMADYRRGLVAREDIEHFAHQVQRLLDDPALQATLSAQAIDKAAG